MLIQTDNYYQSSLLSSIPGIIHGYSGRVLGDMRAQHTRESFLKQLSIDRSAFVMSQQIHSAQVGLVNSTKNSPLSETDALITHKKIFLGVVVADCVPLLVVDKVARVVATIHAGWRGTYMGITTKTIEKMIESGCHARDMIVSIGPHIGMCCYTVSRDRVALFQKLYRKDSNISYMRQQQWHLDIGYINLLQLIAAGIPQEQIDAPVICTSCQVGLFYSYRKDSIESFGEVLGVIGIA